MNALLQDKYVQDIEPLRLTPTLCFPSQRIRVWRSSTWREAERHRCLTRRLSQRTSVRLIVWIGALLTLPAHRGQAISTGITGYSGKQGDTCNQCHSGGVAPTVSFEGPQQVLAGSVATFRFKVRSQSTMQFFGGFNVAASGGLLGVTPDSDSHLEADELTHSAPRVLVDAEASWDFTWQAPSTPGMQTLYGAGLTANGNGTRDGDLATTSTLIVSVVSDTLRGDAQCDGRVSSADLPGVLLGSRSDQTDTCGLADADCDGVVGPHDVDAIIASIFGSPYPGCTASTPTPTATPEPTTVPTPTVTMAPTTPTTPTPTGSATTVTPSSSPGNVTPSPTAGQADEWTTIGRTQQRTYFNGNETRITKANVG